MNWSSWVILGLLYVNVSAARVPVELWTGGDDGLTQRFANAIRSAMSQSSDFSSAQTNQGALLMTIPTHVYWKESQGKINFSVVVIMTDRDRKYLGASTGSCWEADMNPCAERVLADARKLWAARNER